MVDAPAPAPYCPSHALIRRRGNFPYRPADSADTLPTCHTPVTQTRAIVGHGVKEIPKRIVELFCLNSYP